MAHRNEPTGLPVPTERESDDEGRSPSPCSGTSNSTRSSSSGLDVAMVQVAEFDSVVEQHSVALPIEAIGENHSTLGVLGHVGEVDDRSHRVPQAQVDLVRMRLGQ